MIFFLVKCFFYSSLISSFNANKQQRSQPTAFLFKIRIKRNENQISFAKLSAVNHSIFFGKKLLRRLVKFNLRSSRLMWNITDDF